MRDDEAARNSEAVGEDADTQGRPSLGKVMIVDDDPQVLDSTAMLVEALGYEAVRVSDPALILQTVQDERPGAILQDLKIPGLNVAGLIASLRSDPVTATVPLVLFSASPDLPSTAARYDAWGHLSKPFGAAELASLLERILPAGQGAPMRPPAERLKDIRTIFHDYWNVIAAMANYVQVLISTPGLPPLAEKSAIALHDLVLRLESKTDRLRAFALADAAGPALRPHMERKARGGVVDPGCTDLSERLHSLSGRADEAAGPEAS